MKYTWEYSDNVEMWCHDEFDTVEDCIEDAKENYDVKVGDTIAVGEIVPYEVNIFAAGILEDLEKDIYEDFDECLDMFNYKEDKDKLDELSEQLTEIVNSWLEKYNRKPNLYKIEDVKSIEVE